MTNTLIETGARHMQQCRTSANTLQAFAGDENSLINNDQKWCMDKDELVVSCGKHVKPGSALTGRKYAYPSVITCMGPTTPAEKMVLAAYYHSNNVADFKIEFKTMMDENAKTAAFHNFVPVGYSVGKAYAHQQNGDTVASVQIGGLRTVLNGGFEVQTGDLIQMYIPDIETFLFNSTGGRIECGGDVAAMTRAYENHMAGAVKNDQTNQRKNFYTMGQGLTTNGKSGERIKTGMFSIKPYLESANEHLLEYPGDKLRVFARAVSSARPWEPVDIMISRQAL